MVYINRPGDFLDNVVTIGILTYGNSIDVITARHRIATIIHNRLISCFSGIAFTGSPVPDIKTSLVGTKLIILSINKAFVPDVHASVEIIKTTKTTLIGSFTSTQVNHIIKAGTIGINLAIDLTSIPICPTIDTIIDLEFNITIPLVTKACCFHTQQNISTIATIGFWQAI